MPGGPLREGVGSMKRNIANHRLLWVAMKLSSHFRVDPIAMPSQTRGIDSVNLLDMHVTRVQTSMTNSRYIR